MSEGDKQELGEIARSIGALFGDEEEIETAASVGSGGTDEDHVEVAAALGLEDELDTNKESAATSAAGDIAEAGPGVPAETSEPDAGVPSATSEPDPGVPPETSEADPGVPADTSEPDPGVPPDTSEADPVVPAEVEDPEQASIQAGPTPTETAQALNEATSQFLEAPIHEREGAQRVLRSAIEASRSAGAFDEIASSVNVLILKGATDSVVQLGR